jgi:hypothetical protein
VFASVDCQKMPERLILNFGPRTLSRVYCETGKEDTLHVRGLCNHCTPRPNSSGNAARVRNRGRASKVESRRRAEQDATCRVRVSVGHNED